MVWFGQRYTDARVWEQAAAWDALRPLRKELAATPVHAIIDVLDSFSSQWVPGSPAYNAALAGLIKESGFNPQEVEKTLSILPTLLSRASLEKRLRSEFKPLSVLDGFVKTPGFAGKVKATPLGIVLHVTAGNVFLSSIDSLVMGLVTKNLSIVKVSGQNKFFPNFFAQKLIEHDERKIISNKFAILHWKGGERSVEDLFKKKVNGIIAWGGEEMIESYRKDLPPAVKFLDFGPKISVQVISRQGLKDQDLSLVANKIAADIIPWDQGACASPQNLYLQEGVDEKPLLDALEEALKVAPPAGELAPDEAVEILKEQQRGLYSEFMEEGAIRQGANYLLHLEQNKVLRPSPLHRSLIIKRFKDVRELEELLTPFAYYLQSGAYLLAAEEKESFLEALAFAGIKRLAPLGTITWGMDGAPHDGRQVLRELTSLVVDELRIQNYGEPAKTTSTSADLKNFFETVGHPPGYIFSSGGTTGEPKFLHFSYEEFDYVTDMLAENLRAQGVRAGTTVANLFVAGNLWSSFMAVEKALEKLGAVQLPVGGLCAPENIVFYLQKFKPQIVMGIPSLLVTYAEYAEAKGVKLAVEKVFYAGEALSSSRQNYLKRAWRTEYFGSAGYASVDAGIIGYQCSHCSPGEHHLFSDLVDLRIVNDEAVVTSLYRTSMPIQNYRTGDRVEWIDDCGCGRPEPRFRLLGRIDNIIQIWSCRLQLEDIERVLREVAPEVKSYQLILDEEIRGDGVRERMRLLIEGQGVDASQLVSKIYANSRDVRDTISLSQFQSLFALEEVKQIERNARTGKITLVVDRRR